MCPPTCRIALLPTAQVVEKFRLKGHVIHVKLSAAQVANFGGGLNSLPQSVVPTGGLGEAVSKESLWPQQ